MELFVKATESKKPKLHISPLSVFIYAFHLVNNHFLSDVFHRRLGVGNSKISIY